MRVGITLPTFSADAGRVIEAARQAEEAGLDGVFVFDHLWPIGDPSRPSLSLYPVLGAVAAATTRTAVGSLVARVGLLPDEVVLASLQSVARIAPGRMVAGLGTGDSASDPENERLGIARRSAGERRESLGTIADRLTGDGVECWMGAGLEASNDVARQNGLVLNFWDVSAEVVAAETSRGTRVSWAGPLPRTVEQAADRLMSLAAAGATWAVWGWPRSIEHVVRACRLARAAAGEGPAGD